MRCTSPRTVGFYADGKTICWSQLKASKEYASFQLPCSKCLECRLEYARQWALRCVHEAQMHPQNCFITLTYSQEKLASPKLIYSDFQKFMKKLRKTTDNPVGVFVTGEYGGPPQILPNGKLSDGFRPHWHAIIFNWYPSDAQFDHENHRGDRVHHSKLLTQLWGKGRTDLGSVTFESAGYVARYAAKKLIHGHDGHEYVPISKKSSKHAIGKRWIEKFWPDVFNSGSISILGKPDCSIPRYYEKWLKQNQPIAWSDYVTKRKSQIITQARERSEQQYLEWKTMRDARGLRAYSMLTQNQVRKIIKEQTFKMLQNYLKL